MKKTFLYLLFAFCLVSSCSPKVVVSNTDNSGTAYKKFKIPEVEELSDVLSQAQTANKPIFIDVYAVWCGPCKWMDQHTFSNPELQKYLLDNFVCTKVDAEAFEGVNVVLKYNIKSYPTYLFVDQQGNILNRVEGSLQTEYFQKEAQYALDLLAGRGK